MAPFEFIVTQLILVLGMYLVIVGWVGVITGTAFVHLTPFGLQRPTIYLLIAYLIFLHPLEAALGMKAAHLLFIVVAITVSYETMRPMLVSSVNISGASPATVDSDLRKAFQTLGLRYAGHFPSYKLKDPWARLRVKYWKGLGEAQLTIYPSSRREVLTRIEEVLDRDFTGEEQPRAGRAFIVNLIEGGLLIVVAAWNIATHL
ncbi:MAG: hypothetical protein RL518_898 [Pseudomonadota bacterium]